MNHLFERMFLYDEGDAGSGAGKKGGDPPKGNKGGTGDPTPPTFDAWLEGQDDATKGLIDGHVKGLKAALGSERDAREKAEEDLRDVASKLEKGSEAQKEVLRLADAVAEGSSKADFYEDAHDAGVTNIKLAYHVATTEKLFDGRGNVNFETLKANYPELFGAKGRKPSGDAGMGTGTQLGKKADMNEAIRAMSGRKT